jgi:hypothetical protein
MKDARETLNKLVTDERDKEDIIEVAKNMYRYFTMNFKDIYDRTMLKTALPT